MMMMLLLVLGAFVFAAFILGAILVLIYLLRELFYEATGDDAVERKPRAEEPSDKEERLISHGISSEYEYPWKESAAVDGTIGVETIPVSDIAPTQTSRPSCDIRIPCEACPLSSTPHVAAKRGYFTSLKTAFNAVEDFVFGDNVNTSSDSD